eukprot:5469471-Prymnesium_polylepis.1
MVLDRLRARTALKRRTMRRTLLSFSSDGKSLPDHVSSESNGILEIESMKNQLLRYRFAIFLRSGPSVPGYLPVIRERGARLPPGEARPTGLDGRALTLGGPAYDCYGSF